MPATPAGSSPLVGSSSTSSSGSFSCAAATPSRCRIPLRVRAEPVTAARSTRSSTASTRAAGSPAYRATTRRLSRPDRYG
jgi:hypothetical protein